MLGRGTGRGVDGYVLRTALMRIRFDRWSIRNGARHRPFFLPPPSPRQIAFRSLELSVPWIFISFWRVSPPLYGRLRIYAPIYIWGRNSEGFGRRIRNAIRNSRFSSPNKKRYESLRIALFAGMNVVKNNSILLSRGGGGGKKWNYERSIDTGRFQSSRINCENKKRNLPRYA